MGELRDLIAIYGEIDRIVAEDPRRRKAVANLLPGYAKPETRWYDELLAWAREKHERATFPTFEEALAHLGETPPDKPRTYARRMFGIAVATQAYPELLDSEHDWRRLAQRALHGSRGEDDERGASLLDLLASEVPELGGDVSATLDDWWEARVREAVARKLLPAAFADGAGLFKRPCTGELVMVQTPDGLKGVASLETYFETAELEFDDATRFLDPRNWPDCSDFWCKMDEVAVNDPIHSYHEVVSTDCDDANAAWTISAPLDFVFTRIPDEVAIAEYQLSDGHPTEDDDVIVDEGSLVVRALPAGGLGVTTTKRVLFSHSFSGEGLAIMMCPLGYASVAEDFVWNCAARGAPGSELPAGEPKRPAEAGPGPDPVIAAWADAVKACVDDCAQAARASYKKIDEGKYGADALVQDMSAAWTRMWREGATAVELGARTARAVPRKSPAT